MPEALTPLEGRVLDYLVEFLRRNTYQPSVREIGRALEVRSTKTVSELLDALARKGWIERDPARSRGVRILGINMSPATVSVPYAQPAGQVTETLELDRRLAGGAGTYLVAAPPDDACAAGVRCGDLLLCEPLRSEAQLESGDVALLRSAANGAVRLVEWSNTAIPDAWTLHGRVLSVVRRLRAPGHREPLAPGHGEPLAPGA